jgi:DNA-binding NarL/FixJ family response regulator
MRRLRRATQSAAPKPKVLLVDDHRQILDAVSAMLAGHFDVVGLATDGHHAIDNARQTTPDVIVLDINMPTLDGFQTVRALQRAGLARIPVVFLSIHEHDEYVSDAFRCGGRGYVVKSSISRDLMHALDHVLAGRAFVPSITSLLPLAAGGGHAMLLHDESTSSLDGIAVCLDRALQSGDATCVIATRRIRQGLSDRLRARGWDVGESSRHSRVRVIDAAGGVDGFVRDGVPDASRLAEIASELDHYRRGVAGASSRLVVFGNMAATLTADGNGTAALELEHLWSTLTRDLPFLTICGYTPSCFHDGAADVWSGVCAHHWVVSHAGSV